MFLQNEIKTENWKCALLSNTQQEFVILGIDY
jgi:hypothetical protein